MLASVSRPAARATATTPKRSASSETWITASFAQKPDSGGMPARLAAGNREQDREPRCGLQRGRRDPPSVLAPAKPANQSGRQEEVRLHQDVVRGVEEHRRERGATQRGVGLREQADADDDVADLADDVKAQDVCGSRICETRRRRPRRASSRRPREAGVPRRSRTSRRIPPSRPGRSRTRRPSSKARRRGRRLRRAAWGSSGAARRRGERGRS